MKFRHRHKHDDDDEFPRWRHWGMWLRGRRFPHGIFEGANERRARRGDMKFIVLAALSEKPMHGYDIIQSLEQQQEGRYRPSPGSIYPTLQMLEDGGFVTSEQADGKRVYTITEAGRTLLSQRRTEETADEGDDDERNWSAIRDSAKKFIAAAGQGIMHENPKVREQVRAIVDEARKKIYKILAEEN
ncbi:MAG: PadR family transcriptional regulator [Candidatus Eremiobacteraeota bacterium]|nr:PadR family transcriptional regulator [Candidatus Eremiobacteraeota bacterium]MBV8221819.1 PadR family transcriptional regulator [Candidatus Eremiobacteraeota bacterium]